MSWRVIAIQYATGHRMTHNGDNEDFQNNGNLDEAPQNSPATVTTQGTMISLVPA